MASLEFREQLEFRVKDNRVGMGIGGLDNKVTMTHLPSGVTITLPHDRAGHQTRVALEEVMELLIGELRYGH